MINSKHPHGGLFIGILITVMGVIFLLDQMEVVRAAYVFQLFWPMILIALGLSLMFRTSNFREANVPNTGQVPESLADARRTTINFWGPVLIVIGGLWLLSNLTHFDVGRLWPLWMIAIGVWLLINKDRSRGRRVRRRDWKHYGPPPYSWPQGGTPGSGPAGGTGPGSNTTSAGFAEQGATPNPPPRGAPGPGGDAPPYPPPGPAGTAANSSASMDDTFEHSIAFMAFKRRITTQHFRYARLSAVFGGFHLDFTMADMEGSQAEIRIEAAFGGGEIRIPPSWRVSIDAHAFGGAFMDETYARPDPTAPAKTLTIRGSTVFGGVVIKN